MIAVCVIVMCADVFSVIMNCNDGEGFTTVTAGKKKIGIGESYYLEIVVLEGNLCNFWG